MSLVLNNVIPVFAVIALGAAIRQFRLAEESFFRTAERLVYFILFPALLFWKIGASGAIEQASPRFFAAVLMAISLAFVISLIAGRLIHLPLVAMGSFSQCAYRFNTYVGMAVVATALGEPGVATFGIMISLVIPFINVLAVSSLIWFSATSYSGARKLGLVAREVVINPLILACLAGLAYAHFMPPWPLYVENTLSLLGRLSLPLALVAIGGSLSVEKLKGHFWPALGASLIKLVILPLLGWGLLSLWGVEGLAFQLAMLFFALPTATSAYILSAHLGSDPDLAAAAIVLSTLLSFFSLSAVLIFPW
jgi:predicted permease